MRAIAGNLEISQAGDRRESIASVFDALSHLEETYPGFGRWYWEKVVPGLGDGTRMALQATCGGAVEAVMIAKRTTGERKLCTLWTSDRVRGEGVGASLLSEALGWLQDSSPLMTVPEERMPQFRRILRGQGFSLTGIVDSMYRPGAKEYVFNGRRP